MSADPKDIEYVERMVKCPTCGAPARKETDKDGNVTFGAAVIEALDRLRYGGPRLLDNDLGRRVRERMEVEATERKKDADKTLDS